MSPKRRYQTSSLAFGNGKFPLPPLEYRSGGAINTTSSYQAITPAEIAVGPCISYRKINPKDISRAAAIEDLYQHQIPVTSNYARSSSATVIPSASAPAPVPYKGSKTYRVHHHHQHRYEPVKLPATAPLIEKSSNSLSQGIFGLPILQDYLKSIPPPANQEWEFEDLGDTKLAELSPSVVPEFHYQSQKEPLKPRLKATLPSTATHATTLRPGTPPYLQIQDEMMDGIIQIRPASRSSRTRPEQHHAYSSQKRVPRRRVQSTSGHQLHQGRVATASTISASQDHGLDEDHEHIIQDCLNKLKSSDWEEICNAFGKIQRTTGEASAIMKPYLKKIIWLGLPHCSSSRTKVSRAACQCFKKLFETQKRLMEGEGDKVFRKLLDLCGGPSNKFIQEECKEALSAAINNMEGHKCVALIECGAKHKNANVREFSALLLSKIMDRFQMQNGMSKEYGQKVVPMIVGFLKEGQLNTRLNAKECLSKIFDLPNFTEMLHRYSSPENIRHINDTLKKFKSRRPTQS